MKYIIQSGRSSVEIEANRLKRKKNGQVEFYLNDELVAVSPARAIVTRIDFTESQK